MINKLKYCFLLLLFFASCKKGFLDINTNPQFPEAAEESRLLPTAERNLGDALSMNESGGGLSEILEVYMHQLSAREEPDQYGATGNNFNITSAWPVLYQTILNNLNQVITAGTANGNLQYAGVSKILKAYTVSQLVDVFGDVPFSEADLFKNGTSYPKFDDDATIYPALLSLLDEAIANIQDGTAANLTVPGADDVIYGGDMEKWVKAANSIKLKLLVQERKVQDVSAQIQALLTDNNLISSTSESFLLPYGPNGTYDDRNPAFGDYIASQRGNYISPWFYEIMKGKNANIYTGIVDPRVPYYIFNQLTSDADADNQTEYRDGGFVSIYFGSVGQDRDRSQQNSMSLLGIYPAGGRYDDGQGAPNGADGSSGTGAAPYRFITYADVLYLKAEVYKEGVVAGDAKATFQAAVEESFKQVDYVISTYVKPQQNVPALVGTPAVNKYIDTVVKKYTANATKQLEYIMTQKWISSFGSAIDQYTDYRRTGFPILFDPTDPAMAPNGLVQPPINGDPARPGAQPPVPVQLSRTYPLSLPWDQTELEVNKNAPEQKNPSSYKVFWMP